MPREAGLTDAKIKGLKAPEVGQVEYKDALVPGLRLRVGKGGAKTFILRKRTGAGVRNVTLGRYREGSFTLANARKAARTLLSDLEQGRGLVLPQRPAHGSAAGTIAAMFPAYLASKGHLRSIAEVERIFRRYVLPRLGGRLAQAVTRSDVTELIDGIEGTSMARAVLAQLSAFYGWALPRLPDLPYNPCRDAGRPGKQPSRDRVLTDLELGLLWQALHMETGPFGPAVRFLLLSLQRRGEVFEADRSEFDLAGKVWTVPADRAKNGQVHLVPLTPLMVEQLQALGLKDGQKGPLVPSAAAEPERAAMSGFSRAWSRVRRNVAILARQAEIEPPAHFTMHDLRRTGATGLQRMGVAIEVTEAVLNHRSGARSGIVGVYQRHDFAKEKRRALQRWSDQVRRIADGKSGKR